MLCMKNKNNAVISILHSRSTEFLLRIRWPICQWLHRQLAEWAKDEKGIFLENVGKLSTCWLAWCCSWFLQGTQEKITSLLNVSDSPALQALMDIITMIPWIAVYSLTWVSLEDTDSLSSGSEGVKLAEIGVPGIPFAWMCSPSLTIVPSSSSEFWVPSVTASAGSDSAGSPSPPDSLVSEQRFVGSKQCPIARIERGGWILTLHGSWLAKILTLETKRPLL